MAKQRVAVLFGGASKDYSASLQSAYSVIRGLGDKYDVVPVGITKAGRWLYFPGDINEIASGRWEESADCCSAILSPDPHHGGIIKILSDGQTSHQRLDCVFSVVHGKYGECGRIQSLCKLSGVPFVGSEDDAANACTDRMLTHLILNKAGLKTPVYYYLERTQLDELDGHLDEIEATIGYPAYVKAASCSPSIGTNLVRSREELRASVKISFSHHHKVIIEEAVDGRELECVVYGSVYDLQVSEIGEIVPDKAPSGSVYIKHTASLQKAELTDALAEDVREAAKVVFMSLGCRHFAKINFRLAGDRLRCFKASHLPGFTEMNILPQLMAMSGYEYPELLDLLVQLAVEGRN